MFITTWKIKWVASLNRKAIQNTINSKRCSGKINALHKNIDNFFKFRTVEILIMMRMLASWYSFHIRFYLVYTVFGNYMLCAISRNFGIIPTLELIFNLPSNTHAMHSHCNRLRMFVLSGPRNAPTNNRQRVHCRWLSD